MFLASMTSGGKEFHTTYTTSLHCTVHVLLGLKLQETCMNQKKLNKAGPLHNKGNKILYNNRVSLNWYLPPVLGNKPTCMNSYFSQIVTSYYIKIAL